MAFVPGAVRADGGVTFRAEPDYSVGKMSNGHPTPPAPDLIADDARPPRDVTANPSGPPGPGTDLAGEESPAPSAERCLNCAAELAGRFCAQCGQDARRHVLSLRHTVGELLEDISQADARIWRTLRLLALRPGELTCEYLRGKRASYTPPLRLYVALSLLLFLVGLMPETSEPEEQAIERSAKAVSLGPEAAAALDEALEDVDKDYRDPLRAQVINAVAKVPADQQLQAVTDLAEACGKSPLGLAALASGTASELPHEKLVANCNKVAGPAQQLLSDGTEYAPKMMVFFLPLIALFGKFLYLGSRRYYVGHLVFFVHFHAFVFLAMATGNLAGSLAGLSKVKWLDDLSDLLVLGLIICVPIYLYKAMRRVYDQGRWATRAKFMLLGVGYLINFLISAILLAAFIALQSDVDWREALDAIDLVSVKKTG